MFKKMVMYLKFFFLKHIPSTFPPLINFKNVSYPIDKFFFIQTYSVQSSGLELLEMWWNPELIAAPRELALVLVR